MKLSNRTAFAFALAAAATCAGATVAACSSSGSGGTGFNNNDGSVNGEGSVTGQGCSNPTVPIIFSPMYSAYIPGSTAQTFQIPAITADGNNATWSASDNTQVQLQSQTFNDGANPGVMITIQGTGNSNGQVTIYANESGGACGAAVLTITQNAESDWDIGNARYNDGVALHLGPPADGGYGHFDGGEIPDGGFPHPDGGYGHHDGGGGGLPAADAGSFFEEEGGTACTNCHGATANSGVGFDDVAHTPEQTGGFSDTDLANIILAGDVPDGGFWDPSVLDGLTGQKCDDAGTFVSPDWPECAQRAYKTWQSFHKWTDITTDELPGIIVYLRSLTPAPQNGTSNFGGGGHHGDGGGGGPHDGGGGGGGGAGG